jgi:hypothetical protein
MSRHFSDDARIVPVVGQSRIGRVAVGEERGSTLHVGSHEGLDRCRGIVGDHSQAYSAGARIEAFGVLASRLGLIGVAIDHLDGPDDEDFAGIAGLEDGVAFPEGNFRLIDFDDALQGIAIRVDHRPAQFLRPANHGKSWLSRIGGEAAYSRRAHAAFPKRRYTGLLDLFAWRIA